MGDEETVIAFRLSAVEKAIETTIGQINKKLDQLLALQGDYQTKIALGEVARSTLTEKIETLKESLGKDLSELEDRIGPLERASTELQISLAQKIGPGAVGGGIMAAIMMIVNFFMGL